MWVMLLCWACGGNVEPPPTAAERVEPWSTMALPPGRTVSSDPAGLVVRYDHDRVAEIDDEWRAALVAQGFVLTRDDSRATQISCVFDKEAFRVALSIAPIRGTATVSLQEL